MDQIADGGSRFELLLLKKSPSRTEEPKTFQRHFRVLLHKRSYPQNTHCTYLPRLNFLSFLLKKSLTDLAKSQNLISRKVYTINCTIIIDLLIIKPLVSRKVWSLDQLSKNFKNDLTKIKFKINSGDDTSFFISSFRIDTIVNHLSVAKSFKYEFFKKWRIRPNDTKTELVLLSRKRPMINP